MHRRLIAVSTIAVIGLAAGAALAVRPPEYLAQARSFELADRAPVMRTPSLTLAVPAARAAAWRPFVAEVGLAWQGLFNAATESAFYLYGPGIRVPGAVADEGVARAWVERFLARHVALLAPGASATDLRLTHDVLVQGGTARHVGFQQYHQGLPVIDSYVSFLFKNDRMFAINSHVVPGIHVEVPRALAPNLSLRAGATDWIHRDYNVDFSAGKGTAGTLEGPYVLPVVRGKRDQRTRADIRFYVVMAVPVETSEPEGGWRVFVDAATGAAVARQQTLFFADGQVGWRLGKRRPGVDLQELLALHTETSAGRTNGSGTVDVGAGGAITLRTEGPLIRISNSAGTNILSGSVNAQPGAVSVADIDQDAIDELAVYTAFAYMNFAKEYVRVLNPNLTWLDRQTTANVNIGQTCNASFGGNTGNFFARGGGCENTGALADVVMHELGHGVHGASLLDVPFDGGISEAHGDILATTIAGRSNLGEGFILDNPEAGLRELDPPGSEHTWSDLGGSEAHTSGMVYGGAMWDLRKALVARYGETDGVALHNRLWYASVQRAGDIPTAHLAIREADDDDGDLSNGTPNGCTITAAFDPHDIAGDPGEGGGGPSVGTPTLDGLMVSLDVFEPTGECPAAPATGATIEWKLRDDPATNGTVTMNVGANSITGALPAQAPNTVIRYKVIVQFEDGTTRSFPRNPADPEYETYVGYTEEIYCASFDSEPSDWTTGADVGTDNWQWGPAVRGTDDPASAYSGTNVFGNALGQAYDNDNTNWAEVAVSGVSGYDSVRLQYRRWLTVEDGFFDHADILVNGESAWSNFNSDMGNGSSTHHKDREWRFHDVDLTPHIDGDSVTIRFRLESDPGLEFGGWTLDDVCVVGYRAGAQPPECGDGTVDEGEECDDGNDVDGDGCSADCQNEDGGGPDAGPGNPGTDGGDDGGGCGCQVDDGGRSGGFAWSLLALGLIGLIALRGGANHRRRRRRRRN